MKKKSLIKRVGWVLYHSFPLYLLIVFTVSSCMILFLHFLHEKTGFNFNRENISYAASLTFWNVLFLGAFFTIVDIVRRKIFIDRPVKRILDGVEKFINGDFSYRIKPFHDSTSEQGFNDVIDCFNRMAEELSSVETLRKNFIADVSHEIKTPLSVIQNYGTLLQCPDISDEERLEYAKIIASASRRLSDLITNILKLNRLENQKIYPFFKKYNLGEQLTECILQFEDTWEKKEINIDAQIPDDVFIQSDSELLFMVWNNLLSNAFKFTEKGGTVSLHLREENDFVQVEVADTGCGMSEEVRKHIFNKFYQGDQSHATEGNGLGLALVKRIMDIVHGEIQVESEIGKGSTFLVTLKKE